MKIDVFNKTKETARQFYNALASSFGSNGVVAFRSIVFWNKWYAYRMKSATIANTNSQGGGSDVLRIEFDQEADGRWIAEISALPGVMAYGTTREEAQAKVEALALRALADKLDHGETIPELGELFVAA